MDVGGLLAAVGEPSTATALVAVAVLPLGYYIAQGWDPLWREWADDVAGGYESLEQLRAKCEPTAGLLQPESLARWLDGRVRARRLKNYATLGFWGWLLEAILLGLLGLKLVDHSWFAWYLPSVGFWAAVIILPTVIVGFNVKRYGSPRHVKAEERRAALPPSLRQSAQRTGAVELESGDDVCPALFLTDGHEVVLVSKDPLQDLIRMKHEAAAEYQVLKSVDHRNGFHVHTIRRRDVKAKTAV